MDRTEFIAKLRRRPSLYGSTAEQAEDCLDRALLALSTFIPRKVTLLNVEADANNGVYSVGEEIRRVTGVFVAGTNAAINFEVKQLPDGTRQLWLYSLRVPSYISSVDQPDGSDYVGGYFDANNVNRPTYGGQYYENFDLEFSENWSFEDLQNEHHLALELYCDYLGYETRAVEKSNLTDITDREPSGAQTTFRRSQQSGVFFNLMKMRKKEFDREVKRPYWTMDSFGVIERLWSNYQYGISLV